MSGQSEKALTAVVPEPYVQGISTRSVDALVMAGVSKSQVSRLCEEIDERLRTFLERPIEGDWPYLCIDATYVKVRPARAQWRQVAHQVRPKLPKLATLLDEAEEDVLAYMSLPTNPLERVNGDSRAAPRWSASFPTRRQSPAW